MSRENFRDSARVAFSGRLSEIGLADLRHLYLARPKLYSAFYLVSAAVAAGLAINFAKNASPSKRLITAVRAAFMVVFKAARVSENASILYASRADGIALHRELFASQSDWSEARQRILRSISSASTILRSG